MKLRQMRSRCITRARYDPGMNYIFYGVLRPLMRRCLASLFAILAMHAVCAADDERRYEKSYDCGFVEIQAKGAECVDEMDCPSLSSVTHEILSYRLGGKSYPLPSLSNQFPLGPKILKEAGRVYRISQLKCQENRGVAVIYWGGGNCADCEIMVSYSVAAGSLVPQRILKGRWDIVPFVKHYSANDDESVTKWIDPPPK